MTKQEFLNELDIALRGKIDDKQLSDLLAYYNSYIDQQVASGETMEDIMYLLGNPRLIAVSVLNAAESQQENPKRQYKEYGEYSQDNDTMEQYTTRYPKPVSKWKLVAGLAVVGVIGFGILAFALRILFAFGPVVAIIIIVLYLNRNK